jgi:hypothetical protein
MHAVVTRLTRVPPAVLVLVALVVVGAALTVGWGPLTRQAGRTVTVVRSSDPRELALSVVAAAFALACTGVAWVVAARSLGSRATFRAGLARYTVACLAPPKLGNPCRIVLLSRTLPGARGVWAMTGVCGGISLLRVLPLAMLVIAAAARGWLSLWPAIALALGAAALLAATTLLYRRLREERLHRLLSGLALLARSRRTAVLCVGWLSLATLGKVLTATAAASALGLRNPLGQALLLIPALAFGRTLPFLGFAAGAFAVGAGGAVGAGDAVSLVLVISAAEGAAAVASGVLAASQLLRTENMRNWRTLLRTPVGTPRGGGPSLGDLRSQTALRPAAEAPGRLPVPKAENSADYRPKDR